MANGTIAFDTLTTSDSVNTGTEKSIDTSYLLNGVAKVWVNFDGNDSGAPARNSFNLSSTTDNDTGDYTMNFTNAMNDTDYAPQFLQGDQSGAVDLGFKCTHAHFTIANRLISRNTNGTSNTARDMNTQSYTCHGDLA